MEIQLTAIIRPEGSGFVAHCPELDIASQGESAEEAFGNFQEAVQLFFEVASKEEILSRMTGQDDTTGPDIAGTP